MLQTQFPSLPTHLLWITEPYALGGFDVHEPAQDVVVDPAVVQASLESLGPFLQPEIFAVQIRQEGQGTGQDDDPAPQPHRPTD
jgi:hypothetical protein